MYKNIYPLTDTLDFAANTTKNVDIPKSGYITELNFLFTIRVTAGLSVTPAEDPLARLINAARLTASGAKNYFDISDGRQWYYWQFFNYEGQISGDALPQANNSADVTLALKIHWGLDPYVDTDRTIILPSPELQNIKFELDWGSATDLGSGYTIDSSNSKAQISVTELALEAGELRESIWQTLLSPRFEARELSLTATASNLGKTDDVPVGDILYQTTTMILNGFGNRSDSTVTEVGVKYPKERRTPFKRLFSDMKAYSRTKFRTTQSIVGAYMFPWEVLTDKEKGIDLRGAQVGDVQAAYTVGVGQGKIHNLHYAFG